MIGLALTIIATLFVISLAIALIRPLLILGAVGALGLVIWGAASGSPACALLLVIVLAVVPIGLGAAIWDDIKWRRQRRAVMADKSIDERWARERAERAAAQRAWEEKYGRVAGRVPALGLDTPPLPADDLDAQERKPAMFAHG